MITRSAGMGHHQVIQNAEVLRRLTAIDGSRSRNDV